VTGRARANHQDANASLPPQPNATEPSKIAPTHTRAETTDRGADDIGGFAGTLL